MDARTMLDLVLVEYLAGAEKHGEAADPDAVARLIQDRAASLVIALNSTNDPTAPAKAIRLAHQTAGLCIKLTLNMKEHLTKPKP